MVSIAGNRRELSDPGFGLGVVDVVRRPHARRADRGQLRGRAELHHRRHHRQGPGTRTRADRRGLRAWLHHRPGAGRAALPWGYGVPAYVAAGVATLNVLLVVFFLPESLSAERKAELAASPRGGITARRLFEALGRPFFGDALELQVLLRIRLRDVPDDVLAVGAEAPESRPAGDRVAACLRRHPLCLRPARADRAADTAVLRGAAPGRDAGCRRRVLLRLGMSPNVPVLLVVLTPLCFAISIQNTVSQSVLSKTVGPTEIGGAFGLSSAAQNVGSDRGTDHRRGDHRQRRYVGAGGIGEHHVPGAGPVRLEQVREARSTLLGCAAGI